MITRTLFVAALMALLSGLSWASNLTGPEGGWMNKTLTGPISRGSSGPPPTTCGTGVINLSTGCTQPMLGGL